MKRNDIIKFANDHPVCFMATVENDKPHVRIMKLWYADHSGFYFETLSPKSLSKQLHKNHQVEVCFYNNPLNVTDGREMRISGKIEFVTDAAIINKAKKAREYFDDMLGQNVDDYIEVFKLEHGEAHFWDLKTDILKESVENHMMF